MSPVDRKIVLHLRKGESIWKVMSTPWAAARLPMAPGKTAEVSWRVISKKRGDGRIEAIHFIKCRDGAEQAPVHVVLMESKFQDFLSKIRLAIEQFAPGTPMKVGDLSDFDELEFGPCFVRDPDIEEKVKAKGLWFPTDVKMKPKEPPKV
jgi:hypothetical protein